MAELVSPGVQVTITDETTGSLQSQGTVPLIFMATQSNKVLPSGTGIASGTLDSNAGKIYNITSQRELLQTFGNPYVRVVDGTVQQGDELNEYGLHAAYSYLGLANSVMVVRADINTQQLIGTETQPTSNPANGTYWFDYLNTSYGAFRANGNPTAGLAWDRVVVKTPSITEVGSSPDYAPLATYGSSGDIAVSVWNTSNTIYEKISTAWYKVGSAQWQAARQTVLTATVGFTTIATVGVSGNLVINDTTIAIADTLPLAQVAAAIVGVTNVTASVATIGTGPANTFLRLTNTAGQDITIGATSTAGLLTALGLAAGTTYGYHLVYATHTSVPSGTHGGDIWIKTTTPNYGTNYVVKRFNSTLNQFQTVVSSLYYDDVLAEIGGGITIGNLYTQYNSGTIAAPLATQYIKRLGTLSSVTTITTAYSAPSAGTFTIRTRSSAVTANVDTSVVVTVSGSETVSALATLINGTVATNGKIPHIVATVSGTQLQIASTNGTAFQLIDGVSPVLSTITMPTGMHSNWVVLTYEANSQQPSNEATEGTLWFNPALTVDIMVNDGDEWIGYRNKYPATDPNGTQVTSEQPTTQSNGNPLVDYDLWIDSSDTVNYPKIYRYLSGAWNLIDNTDQTTPMGIVFGDARKDSGPSGFWLQSKTSPLTGTSLPNSVLDQDLLHSNFVDPVDLTVLNPQTYPSGILLFNTRISTDNVKVRRNTYYTGVSTYTVGAFLDNDYETAHPGSRAAVSAYLLDDPARWVNYSGNDYNGVAYMGRFAQRNCIVRALAEQIVGNQQIRAEGLYFNLMAAPGYVEVFSNLVTLNVDRAETAFIITDVPATLSADSTSLSNWASNTNNVPVDGRLGRITAYDYSAMYYPWGLGTNVDGNQFAIPSSTIALRTYGYNDRVGYPWTSPAGTRRGIISNASSVGYVDIDTHEYTPTILNQGQRDTLYVNKINPLAFIQGKGLLVRGDKTLTPSSTSLLSRVNVARLVVYLRWILPKLLEDFLFELNTEATQNAAADVVSKFLSGLIGLNAISDFVVDMSSNTPETAARNELWINVLIVPVESINFILVPIRLANSIEQV